jgi:peptide/nickel transport system ATP-binding protein
MPLLEAIDLTVRYAVRGAGRGRGTCALDGVSLRLEPGERVGLVGESGSGKTTLAKALIGLERPSSGEVRVDGELFGTLSGEGLGRFRRRVQMVFQDPMGSLNPRLTVGAALGEALAVHRIVPRGERSQRVAELLDTVGLDAAYAGRYPHEFSGGQRQRVGIARALALEPELLIADEPVSALDVSVQAQVLNLLGDLCEARRMALLLVAHDLAVVNYVCRRVVVMYLGRVVEEGPVERVFGRPAHPYTAALRAAVPDPDRAPVREGERGLPAVETAPPAGGCSFSPRCPLAMDQCRTGRPELQAVGEGHRAACWLAGRNAS